MPAEEHPIAFYVHDEPQVPDEVEFEYSADGLNWAPIAAEGVAYYPFCYSGTVYSEAGYLRARGLVVQPEEQASPWSDVQVLPEPSGGLIVALLWLALIIRCSRRPA